MFLSETLSMSVSFAFLIKSPSGVLPTTREEKKEFKGWHYVALQKTYQAKAEADFLVLTKGLGLF
ncbi:hypothetical protein RchiOBHm_Chr3g0476741 [Rosa chinensis]|uniref:Uncharacterized protein n=1 Tax=Rosa chinensis TaxID=74649 RepID=A0A2P6RCQ4_ROSCH|nr:hypothetical protein RchiOBHm_Chr3g0476741 [Rosa chinensis]